MARSWKLLAANPAIVVPGLVIGVLAGFITELLSPSRQSLEGESPFSSLPAAVASALTVDLVAILATLLSIAYTTGMASAAWQRGKATFSDGRHALTRNAGHIVVAMLGLGVLGALAALLAPFTVLLSLVVYALLCIYAMPAAVVGDRRGLVAIVESARIAFVRPLPTLAIVLGIVAIAVVMGIVGELVSVVPFIGPILSAVVLQAVVAYATLVIVGEYLSLRTQEGSSSTRPAEQPSGSDGVPE